MKNSNLKSYPPSIKFLHWLIALIVITMLAGSFFLEDLPKQFQGSAYMLHKSFGLTILFLMILRLIVVWIKGKPQLPVTTSSFEKKLAHLVQYSFYLFLILMPFCGWIMSVAANKTPSYFGFFSLPLPIAPNKNLAMLMNQSHKTIAWILIVLLVFHVAGAIKHHFIDKDVVLKRMLPGRFD